MIDPHPNAPEPVEQDHLLSNKTYDRLKFLAQIGLPALGSLYFALAGIWGLPAAEQVVGSIVAIDTFLGIILQIGTKSYNKSEAKYDGSVDIVDIDPTKKTFTLNLNRDPEEIEQAGEIRFKVNPPTE